MVERCREEVGKNICALPVTFVKLRFYKLFFLEYNLRVIGGIEPLYF